MTHGRAVLVLPSWSLISTLIAGLLLVAWDLHPARAKELLSEPAGSRTDDLSSQRARSGGGRFRFTGTERCFMRRINTRRSQHGLPRLRWDWQIGFVARQHARRMARAGTVWHHARLGRVVTHWTSLAQNTGGGGRSCAGLSRRFWRSPAHRANILGRWRHIGVGAKWRRGRVYVQQVFQYRVNPGNVFGYP